MVSPSPAVDVLSFQYPPDCVEFSPSNPCSFVVGSYYLEDGERDDTAVSGQQRRSGQIVLCHIDGEAIVRGASVDTNGGAYDIHFAPVVDGQATVLGVATSTGLLSVYEVLQNGLQLQKHVRLASEDVLITSFAWHPHQPGVIAATHSSGAVMVYRIDSISAGHRPGEHSTPETQAVWSLDIARHSEAAWHVSWSPSGQQLLHGGDDMVLGIVNAPEAFGDTMQGGVPATLTAVENRRIHGAGVTAVLHLGEDWILTGSYDDHLRLLHVADGRFKNVAEIRFDDGVFMLRVLWQRGSLHAGQACSIWILASCMRAGSRILKLERPSGELGQLHWSISVVAVFSQNESLCYASDCRGNNVVSVSFYDKKAFLWRWDTRPDPSEAEERL